MDLGAFTDAGEVRKDNEDSFYIPELNDELKLFLVSDGIGGQKHGEIASKATIDNIVKFMKDNFNNYEDKGELLHDATISANRTIKDISNENEEYKGMGATLVAMLYDDKEKELKITHAGDSRCYIIRKSIISQLTVDNSYVEYLLQKGVISAEEAKNHPQKNLITKAIGMEQDIDVEIDSVEVKNKDIFLLCSDGLTSMLSDEDILHIILKEKGSMQECAEKLVVEAKLRGGFDNITVILLEV